ncbi:MAG: SDR family oxidoreductase, partial [Rhodospirillales bacterium]|nr:SDR family oxidoreductase [Rhodospirillales bacterium]
IHLTRTLALELARHKIRVNAIAPGYVETDLNKELLGGPTGDHLRKRVPQRRFAQPADLDGALLLLCSNAGAYMTGSVITVDGGMTLSTL